MCIPFNGIFQLHDFYVHPGLLYDDLLIETPQVKEALRRLPPHLYDERVYRVQRAMQANLRKEVLPEEKWTKFEDVSGYLFHLISNLGFCLFM